MSISPRQQVKQRFTGSSFFGFSKGLNRSSILESKLELEYYALRLFFLNKDEDFITQPDHVVHHLYGRPNRYTPDGALYLPTTVYKEEVKYFDVTLKTEFIEKKEYLTELYATKNEVFRVITEEDIRVGHRVDNIARLSPSLHHPAPIKAFKELTEGLDNKGYDFLELIEIARDKKIDSLLVQRSIAHRLFTCDLTQKWKDLVFFV
ncbi:hypothetical protein [Pseudocolwellia sp. HL-MZ7]|uniref:hypothetical protein n=1 Tax=Pseudocolwellia sp. HL-MZ7 TaxID=3400627 RepID=UPI003CF403B7